MSPIGKRVLGGWSASKDLDCQTQAGHVPILGVGPLVPRLQGNGILFFFFLFGEVDKRRSPFNGVTL